MLVLVPNSKRSHSRSVASFVTFSCLTRSILGDCLPSNQRRPMRRSMTLDLRHWIFPHNSLDPLLVLSSVSLEEVVGLSLGGRIGVGLIEKLLDAKKNLFERDGRFPRLLFV